MSVARREARLVTAEELWEMPEVPGKVLELVDGEVVEVPGAGALHALIVELVLRLLGAHARERDLGLAFGDNTSYILRRNPDMVRIPDVSFVSWGRVREEGVPEGYWELAPDLAVEVVSPNDRAEDVYDKVSEYLGAGTRVVWLLWPRRRMVTVRGADGAIRELGPEGELDGGDVLPGFRVRVGELFEVRRAR